VASSIANPPHNKNTISVPINGTDATKLVITIAAQKLI